MTHETTTECEFVQVLPDGAVVVRVGAEEWPIQLQGIAVPQPPPPGYFQIFDRIARSNRSMRCTIMGAIEHGRRPARLSCYGWQDKSGDVWLDVATLLIEEGVAGPTPPEQPQP
jgi:hypothetical protein